MNEEERGTPPVFIPCRNLPDDSNSQFTVREICTAAEKTSGYNTIIGAQRIGSLWRIYPKNVDARMNLLLKGLEVRHLTINPFDKNPFIVKTPDGETEIKTMKLIIGNLPLSYSNEDIEKTIIALGCKLHSKIMMERDRDDRGGLTRWLTGRRFVYVRQPEKPLPEKIEIGRAIATLYYRGQRQKSENAICSRCLVKGHFASMCQNDIVCRACKQSGHKQGHASCPVLDVDFAQNTASLQEEEEGISGATSTSTSLSSKDTSAISAGVSNDTFIAPTSSSRVSSRPMRRGRSSSQPTLNFTPSRSQSREKRPRSPIGQLEETTKTARRDHVEQIQTPMQHEQEVTDT